METSFELFQTILVLRKKEITRGRCEGKKEGVVRVGKGDREKKGKG